MNLRQTALAHELKLKTFGLQVTDLEHLFTGVPIQPIHLKARLFYNR